jgi:hypothetical protein
MVMRNKNVNKLQELTGSIKKNDATIIAQNQYGVFLMFESVVAMPTFSVIPVDYSTPQGEDAHIHSLHASPVLYVSIGNTLPPPRG